jgi:hypothetical protein
MSERDITPDWIEPRGDGDMTDDPAILLHELGMLRQRFYAHGRMARAQREAYRRAVERERQ